jgi:HD-GYP domain-containing protein (c-di-GMP phosphodiesterase class II)
MTQDSDLLLRLNELNEIGIALSSEHNISSLLETILVAAKRIAHADAGTLYLLDAEQKVLRFEILRTDSLKFAMGGTSGDPVSEYLLSHPVRLEDEAGKLNLANVAACAVNKGKTINIPDAYTDKDYDFSGTKMFDLRNNYHSTSFLTVPMRNHEDKIIGVLQLINALDQQKKPIPFTENDERLTESLSSQAAIALTNRRLIDDLKDRNEELKVLFRSIIKLINTAIGIKSPYTGGHCERVPELTMMLAKAANRANQEAIKAAALIHHEVQEAVNSTKKYGELKDFSMSPEGEYELEIAGQLHDCGKIATPVHVVDKAFKLQTLFDRIHLLDTRFEVLKRDAEISMLRDLSEDQGAKDAEGIRAEYEARIRQLDDDRAFLRFCNVGGEAMSEESQKRVRQIATYQWCDPEGKLRNFLSDVDTPYDYELGDEKNPKLSSEVENICIRAGTLTADEREIINDHIRHTITLLKQLPWPKHLTNVTEYAGGHHERMDGKGYPNKLTRDEMSWQARMMGIADIFEALTASDRPYKKGKTLSESLAIMGKFKLGGHIDPDLFDVFMREKVYLTYAQQFLDPEQIDEVDVSKIPGYQP